jgi:hypothetical protein
MKAHPSAPEVAMTPQSYVLLTTILLLFPLGYLFLACPAFLLVRLSVPKVPVLLRAMFRGYFWMLMIISPLAVLAYAVAEKYGPALGVCVIAALAYVAYPWFIRHFNMALEARDAGDITGVARMRRLHVGGMLVNCAVLATVILGIPYVV